MCPDNLFGHLAATAIPGVEEWRDGAYRRTLRLPNGPGIVSLRPGPEYIACQLALTDLRDLAMAISRCRRLLDLDADPVAVGDQLSSDEVLAPLVEKAPGRGCRRAVDAEMASARYRPAGVDGRGARGTAAERYGEAVDDQSGGPTQLFDMAMLAKMDAAALRALHRRRQSVPALARAVTSGTPTWAQVQIGGGQERLAILPV